MKIRIYKYKTRGIYEWGRGFVSGEVADRWNEFWHCVNTKGRTPNTDRPIHSWRILPGEIGCDTLVATGGSIYLHPMDGCGVIQTINEVMPDATYAELCRLMNACVEYIGNGASVEMYTSKIKTIKE
jgi:hypothetical protein